MIVFSKDANLLGRGAEQRRKERTWYCESCPRVHHDVTGELKYSNICKLMKKYCQLAEFETPRWLPSRVITFTRFSENLTSDPEVGVTESICRCTSGINLKINYRAHKVGSSRPEPFRPRGKNDERAHLTGELKTLYMKTVGSSQRPSFHRQQRSSREIDVMKRTDRPVRGKKLSFCSSSKHQHFTRTHNTAAPERQDFYATGEISRLDPIGFVLYVQTHQRVAISAALIPAGLREADLSASLWASGPCAIPPSLRLNKKVVIPDRYIHSCLFQMMWATLFMKHSKRKKCLCLSSCKAKRESPDSGVCLLFLAARGCWCSRVQLLSSPSAFCCIMPQKKKKKNTEANLTALSVCICICISDTLSLSISVSIQCNYTAEIHTLCWVCKVVPARSHS